MRVHCDFYSSRSSDSRLDLATQLGADGPGRQSPAIYLPTLLSQSIIPAGDEPVTGRHVGFCRDLLYAHVARGNRSKQTDFERFIWRLQQLEQAEATSYR